MSVLLDIAYLIGGLAASPLLLAKSLRTGKYRSDWKGRLGQGPEVLPRRERGGGEGTRMLLLHCVSVGELNSVQTLIGRLLAADENLHITVSTTTDTGTERARKLYGTGQVARVHAVRYPLDLTFAVESLLDRVRPDAIALVELETWPNFVSIAAQRRIPMAIINGRLTAKSFSRYRLIGPVMRAMLRRMEWIGAQTETIAARFVALGAAPQRVEVVPTLKYDNAPAGDVVPGQEALAQSAGIAAEHQLFVAGSTGPGEETPLLDAFLALRGDFPSLRLAIAPRHPEVVPQVLAALQTRGLAPVRRSEHPDQSAISNRQSAISQGEVFVLDTMGELKKLYALAFAVFVGRSLVPLGGSDMIEPAALGKPCLFGPHTANFEEVVELLTGEHAATVVKDGSHLEQELRMLLANPAAAADMGRRAHAVIAQQRGSTEWYVRRLVAMCRKR